MPNLKYLLRDFQKERNGLVDIISKIEDSVKENKEAKLLILLFDEPDQSLHPEWSRCFIDIITQVIIYRI